MKQMKIREPKFRVGDKVKNIWNENVYTVTSVTDTGYMLDDRYLSFSDANYWMLSDEPEPTPEPVLKFKVGDKVKHKVVDPHNPATRYIYTVFEIENDKYCLDHNDHESWIPISAQGEFELVNESEPIFKLGVDPSVVNDVDNIWRNTLTDLVGGVTKRNTDAFVWLIDETLRFMDCGAYDEHATNGM